MIIALDVETTKLPFSFPWQKQSYLVSIHMARSDGVTKSWLINHPASEIPQQESLNEVQQEINSATKVIGHNFKFDLLWFIHVGLSFEQTPIYCTMVAEYILRRFQKITNLKLDTLAEFYKLPHKLDKVKMYWDSGYNTDEVPAQLLCEYGERDAELALQVYAKQVPQVVKNAQNTLVSLEMATVNALAEAEYNGMMLDTELLRQYKEEYDERIAILDSQIKEILGDININSGAQLSAAIYGGTYEVDGREETRRTLKDGTVKIGSRKCKVAQSLCGLGIDPLPNTETKKAGVYKTDATTLMQLKAKDKAGKKFLKLYKERAKLDTLNKTFFTGLLERVQDDGCAHPTINQTITKTSRLSCSNPNLQNIPRGDTGPVKQAFISRYRDG